MSRKRLSPQPTDTRLARWVARRIARWPFALASTVRDRDAKIGHYRRAKIDADIALNTAYHDLEEIMRRLTPPVISPHVEVYDMMVRNEGRITIHFDPVHMAFQHREMSRTHPLGMPTKEWAERAAENLAIEHAKQVKRAIGDNLIRILRKVQ